MATSSFKTQTFLRRQTLHRWENCHLGRLGNMPMGYTKLVNDWINLNLCNRVKCLVSVPPSFSSYLVQDCTLFKKKKVQTVPTAFSLCIIPIAFKLTGFSLVMCVDMLIITGFCFWLEFYKTSPSQFFFLWHKRSLNSVL